MSGRSTCFDRGVFAGQRCGFVHVLKCRVKGFVVHSFSIQQAILTLFISISLCVQICIFPSFTVCKKVCEKVGMSKYSLFMIAGICAHFAKLKSHQI